MVPILHIAPATVNARKITSELRQMTDVQTENFNYDRIRLSIAEYKPSVILISVSELTNSEKETVDRVIIDKPADSIIVMGNEYECNEFYNKAYSPNINRYIMTPITVIDMLAIIRPCIPADMVKSPNGRKDADKDAAKKRILIVDDDVVFLRMMTNVLKDTYKVTVAKSAITAISQLGREIPDLMLLDYEMPVLDGPQMLQLIQSEELYKDIPVFFLTGQTDPGPVKRALILGPVRYILKSSGQKVIMKRINEFFTEVK